MNISRRADYVLGKIDVAAPGVVVDLVKVLSAKLGFTGTVQHDYIHRVAFSIGLERCVQNRYGRTSSFVPGGIVGKGAERSAIASR